MSFGEQTKTEVLKKRVVELEKALEEADKEMEEVVGRMNVAQIEVMELQNEREDAVRMTRKLKAQLEDERVKGFEQRFQSLSS
jgi:chromosome segregation ATPase